MNHSMRASMRAFDRESDRLHEEEENIFQRQGYYSSCAGCGDECNPSNIHADGRKFCDACWEMSDDYEPLSPSEKREISLREKFQQQMAAAPVKRHSTRLNFMRYAERVAKAQPIVNGNSDHTYQMFVRWFDLGFLKRRGGLQAVMGEAVSRRQFVFQHRNELAEMVNVGLRLERGPLTAPGRLRERCDVDDILRRFANWCPNSNTDYKALEYLEALSSALKERLEQ